MLFVEELHHSDRTARIAVRVKDGVAEIFMPSAVHPLVLHEGHACELRVDQYSGGSAVPLRFKLEQYR